jgi:hypothetical protein
MNPVVIVALHFLFPKRNGWKDEAGEVVLINGDVPRVMVKAPGTVQIENRAPGRCWQEMK